VPGFILLMAIGFDAATWQTFGMWWGIATILVELILGYVTLDRLFQGY
jgi:hypothetical protein